MNRLITGGLNESQARQVLVETVTTGLQAQAGYTPSVMPVIPPSYALARPLAMFRVKPVFHMSYGWFDVATEWLRERGAPSEVAFTIKNVKGKDGVTKKVEYRTSTLQIFVDKLRLYVQSLDRKHREGTL